MTLEEAQKLAVCLFDIYDYTPYVRHLGGENYAVEVIFEKKILSIKTCRY